MKKIVFGLSLLAIIFANTSCKETVEEEINLPIKEVNPNQNHSINSVLWHQTAAEYRALCYQTYNLARIQFDKNLQQHAFPYGKPPAIIMDLDETVVDNSFFNAQLVLDSANFSRERWKEWSDLMKAGAVPGALEFIKYVQSKDVEVFFISNRREVEVANTKMNLERLGLAGLDTNNFYFRVEDGSKKGRRNVVAENHEILMLFGDNLADFTEVFDKRSVQDRNQIVDSLQSEFGTHFIILPNALYGEWEGAMFDYKYDWTTIQKDSIRRSWLTGY